MNNTSSPNRLPTILLLLAAVGVPSAAGFAFAHTVTQYPWQALGLALLYEVIVLIVGIVGKVWQRLEGQWVERIATHIDIGLQEFFSRYRQQYCQHLLYQHRDFDVKGLSTQGVYTLDLEEVFVELSIDLKPAHQASSNPIPAIRELNRGGKSIWNYLTLPSLAKQHLVIIGPPGSGKTTILRHVVLVLAAQKLRRQIKVPHKLPVLLFLRDHADAIKQTSNFALIDAIGDHLKKWGQAAPRNWIEQQLSKGQCLVLLDGLDEVADPQVRQQVAAWVERQMVAYHKNRFVITSRPFGYRSNPLSGVTVLEVNPFTAGQVKQFVYNWYRANEVMSSRRNDPGVHMRARIGANDLLRRLYITPALFALAANPLLLTMIATVHRYRSSLPGKRVALYAEICEVFLGKRQEARGLTLELSAPQKQRVLQPLAYHLMERGLREIPLSEACDVIAESLERVSSQMSSETFLQTVENTSGVLLERESGIYSFAHLTFQEYLTATYIREKKWEQVLIDHIEDSWWHETTRLYCAQADATPVIAACLTGIRPSVAALLLALECQLEALEVHPTVIARLNILLEQGVEDTDLDRQRVVAEAFLARRLRQMAYLNEETSRDTSLITCAEYQIFLYEQEAKGINVQPDHWTETHFPSGQGRHPVLGVRPSDAVEFCKWLTQREPGVWHYRLPKVDEPNETRDEGVFSTPTANVGYWITDGQSCVLKKGSPSTIDDIMQELSSRQGIIDRYLEADRARTLAQDLANTLHLNLNLDHLHESDLLPFVSRACTCAHNRVRDLSPYLDLDLIFARVSHISPDLDFYNAQTLIFSDFRSDLTEVNKDFARAHSEISDLIPDLGKAIERARFRRLLLIPPEGHIDNTVLYEFLRWYIRFCALTSAVHLLRRWEERQSPQTWIQRFPSYRRNKYRRQMDDAFQHAIDIYLDLYIAFSMLEERIQGRFPACEGILIVKEHAKFHPQERIGKPGGWGKEPTAFLDVDDDGDEEEATVM